MCSAEVALNRFVVRLKLKSSSSTKHNHSLFRVPLVSKLNFRLFSLFHSWACVYSKYAPHFAFKMINSFILVAQTIFSPHTKHTHVSCSLWIAHGKKQNKTIISTILEMTAACGVKRLNSLECEREPAILPLFVFSSINVCVCAVLSACTMYMFKEISRLFGSKFFKWILILRMLWAHTSWIDGLAYWHLQHSRTQYKWRFDLICLIAQYV